MSYNRRYNSRRRYRRNSNSIGGVVGDAASLASRLTPKGALIVGVVGFVLLYFVAPWGMESWLEHSKANLSHSATGDALRQVLDSVLQRRFIRPFELAGIAVLLVSFGIAAWKLYTEEDLSRGQTQSGSLLAKLFARLLD